MKRTRLPRKPRITVIGGEHDQQEARVRKPTDPVTHEYDQSDFRVPAMDARGHKEPIHFDVPPGYKNQIGIVLGSKRYPYETEGQFMRHALKRHLQWLTELEPDLPNDLPAIKLIDAAVDRQEMMLNLNQSFHRIEKTVHELTSLGLRGEAVRMVWEIKAAVDKIDQPQWYNYLSEQMEVRWGHLLQTKPLRLAETVEG